MTSTLTELPDHAALLAAGGNHPITRWLTSPDVLEQAWSQGDAVGWTVSKWGGGRTLWGLGSAADAGGLVTAVLGRGDASIGRVIVPVGALAHVDTPLGAGDDWDWFWTAAAPDPRRPGEDAVRVLGAADLGDLEELLRLSSPRSSAMPDDASVEAWYGVRDASGTLVACAARDETVSGVPHLRAIATHPSFRGRGLGADVTAAVTRAALAGGAEAVTLGMYADNDVARRLYERLGYQVGQAFATRAVAGR
nr:GNAT family N-acetyltransferase [Jiangella mangrovi]